MQRPLLAVCTRSTSPCPSFRMDSMGKRLWAALWGSRSCRLRLPPSSAPTATSDQSELQQDQPAGKSIGRSTFSCSCAKDEHARRKSMPRQASLGGNRDLFGCSTASCYEPAGQQVCTAAEAPGSSHSSGAPRPGAKGLRGAEDVAPFALGDLPASVLPEVFKHLPPADLLRMAQVCCEFRDWLALDMIWAAQLPPSLPQILCKATPAPMPIVSAAGSGGKRGSEQCAMSPQQRVRWLCEGVAVSEGRQRVRMDARTRAIVCETCVALAVRAGAASIVRSGMVRDWVRASGMAGAAFPTSVAFKPVGGYELAVSGLPLLLSVLPPGEYSVGWRVKANPQLSSRQAIPPLTATLSMAVHEGVEGVSVCSLAAWRPSPDPVGSASRMSALANSALPSSSSSPSSLLLRAPSAPSSSTTSGATAAAAAAPAAAPAAAASSPLLSAAQAHSWGTPGGGTGQGPGLAATSQARPGDGHLARVAWQEGVGTVMVPSRVEVKVQAFLDARMWVVLDVGVVRIPQWAVEALDDVTPILDLSFTQQPGAPQPGVLLDCLVLRQR